GVTAVRLRLPFLSGNGDRNLRGGGAGPAARGPGLQLQHLPHGGDAVHRARRLRVRGLPRPAPEGPGGPSPRARPVSGRRRRPFMSPPITRRRFVGTTLTAGALAGLGDFAFLRGLPAVAGDEAKATPKTCQLSPDIEPLVRLIEETPRDKLIAAAA